MAFRWKNTLTDNDVTPEHLFLNRRQVIGAAAAGLALTNRIELTVVDVDPDGGPQAAVFPALDRAAWDREVLAEVPAEGDVPAHRYERLTRRTPVTL